MVQYVFTPWKDRRELLEVRRNFYPDHQAASHGSANPRTDRQRAVSRVSMWMQRGGCPHMVESTALLVAAMIADDGAAGEASASYAVRAAYSAAFSRFVTGLLDGYQDKSHKMSMYSVAKTIGLPATFVELRHQATHDQLPSLTRLRAAAAAALIWIWDYYWARLGGLDEAPAAGDEGSGAADAGGDGGACRDALLRMLEEEDDGHGDGEVERLVATWGRARVLRVLDAVGDDAEGRIMLRTLRLARRVAALEGQAGNMNPATEKTLLVKDPAALRDDLEQSRLQLAMEERAADERSRPNGDAGGGDGARGDGWAQPAAPWRSKPIGVV